jgi:hypothetical protein
LVLHKRKHCVTCTVSVCKKLTGHAEGSAQLCKKQRPFEESNICFRIIPLAAGLSWAM